MNLQIPPERSEFTSLIIFNQLRLWFNKRTQADESGPQGLDPGRWHTDLVLTPADMPQLQILEPRNIFVCHALTDFLVAHADTLEELVMTDCIA